MKQKGRQKLIRTTIEIGIATLIIIASLNILSSIFIKNYDSFQIQIDSPVETYKFEEMKNFSRITIASKYVVFNDTGFNVTPSNAIEIIVHHIDEDISSPANGNDDLVYFEVNNTPGDTWFNISGFTATLSYTIEVNSIFFSTEIADANGVISFTDNPSINDEYVVYWAAGTNSRPVITNPVPNNSSTGISITPTLQADISDPDANPMDWYFYTNDSGSWTEIASASGIGDSTISNASTGHFTTGYTKYWWSVNVTDSLLWTNHTYHFTTTGAGTPVVQTNNPTNIQEINVTLQGELLNDGGENCLARFEWGNITNPVAHNTSNQTKTSEGTFSSSIRGNLVDWYNTDWLYRKKITIDGGNFIEYPIINFPLFVNITDSYFQYARDPDGYDFVFTSYDGTTQLNHEIDQFTYANNNLLAWVNVSSINNSGTTDIYLYWGNLSSTDQQNPTGVWNRSIYVAVYHLDEQSGSTVFDSTINGYDATYMGDLPTRNNTRNGWCQYFDGESGGVGPDYIIFPDEVYNQVTNNSAGFSAQFKHSSSDINNLPDNVYRNYFRLSNSLGNNTLSTYLKHTHSGRYYHYGGGDSNGTGSWFKSSSILESPVDEWFYMGMTWNPSLVYLGYAGMTQWSAPSGVVTNIPSDFSRDKFYLGINTNLDPASDFQGNVDEIRIYNSTRFQTTIENAWKEAETHSYAQTSGFITYYDAETYYQDTGNMSAGTLYYYKAVANNTVGQSNGNTITFLTAPYPPALLAALTENKSAIQLTWTQIGGSGYNTTYIERSSTSTPWSRGSRTEVYNGTLFIYNDTGLNWSSTHYYQAWSYANWTDNTTLYSRYSITFDSANNRTNSLPVVSNIVPANHSTVDTDTTLSIDINDPDGNTFNWSIEIDPSVGYSNHSDDTNGTKTAIVNLSHDTNYTWYVNITDGYDWANYSYNFTAEVQYVNAPTNGVSVYDTTNNRLNLSWTGNSRANNYTLIQRNDTYASSVNQSGNWVRQNSSSLYWNNSWTETSGGYFTVFSWNWTGNIYSYNTSTPLGLNIPWGALKMQCYDETNSTAIIFDVLITNEALETLNLWNKTNPAYLDINDIPYGDDTIFYVSDNNDKYESRTYYHDLALNNFYNLYFFLPLAMPDGGTSDPDYDPDNESYSTLYLVSIINEYDTPVEDVKIKIMRYINASDKWLNVSILMSDANGQADVYLYSGTVYKVNLSKSGYITRTDDWIPSDSIFTKTFKIYFTPEVFENETDCISTVLFTAQQDKSSLFVNYTDSLAETVNTTIYIYEYNHSTGIETLFATYTNTSNSIINLIVSIDSNNTYTCTLYYSHTTCGDGIYTRIAEGHPTGYKLEDTTPARVITLFTAMYGSNPFGWQNVIALFTILLCFFSFGQRNSGLALLLGGGVMLFLNAFIGLTVIAISLSIVYLALGVLMQWHNHRKEGGG